MAKHDHYFVVNGDETIHLHSQNGTAFDLTVSDSGAVTVTNSMTGESSAAVGGAVVDETLTKSGYAADAKKTGDALNSLNEDMANKQPKGNYVKTINGVAPDAAGDIAVSGSGGAIDTDQIATAVYDALLDKNEVSGAVVVYDDDSTTTPLDVISTIDHSAEGKTGCTITHKTRNLMVITAGKADENGLVTIENDTESTMYWSSQYIEIEPGDYNFSCDIFECTNADTFLFLQTDGNDYSRSLRLDVSKSANYTIDGTQIHPMVQIEPGARLVWRMQLEKDVDRKSNYIKAIDEEFTVDFGQTVYGGEYNWSRGILTITKDSSGNALETPEQVTLEKTSVERVLGEQTFASDTGDTTVSGYKAVADAYPFEGYNIPVLRLTGSTAGMTKENEILFAYKYSDRDGVCTVKWQGSSSLAYPKKNYTIKFDGAFEVQTGWGAQKKYCFKANWIDCTHARNVCLAKLWGMIAKSRDGIDADISALPNAGAIDGFPCIIVINGQFHGLYTWNIPKDG